MAGEIVTGAFIQTIHNLLELLGAAFPEGFIFPFAIADKYHLPMIGLALKAEALTLCAGRSKALVKNGFSSGFGVLLFPALGFDFKRNQSGSLLGFPIAKKLQIFIQFLLGGNTTRQQIPEEISLEQMLQFSIVFCQRVFLFFGIQLLL